MLPLPAESCGDLSMPASVPVLLLETVVALALSMVLLLGLLSALSWLNPVLLNQLWNVLHGVIVNKLPRLCISPGKWSEVVRLINGMHTSMFVRELDLLSALLLLP